MNVTSSFAGKHSDEGSPPPDMKMFGYSRKIRITCPDRPPAQIAELRTWARIRQKDLLIHSVQRSGRVKAQTQHAASRRRSSGEKQVTECGVSPPCKQSGRGLNISWEDRRDDDNDYVFAGEGGRWQSGKERGFLLGLGGNDFSDFRTKSYVSRNGQSKWRAKFIKGKGFVERKSMSWQRD